MLLLTLALGLPQAEAFCGAYVGAEGASLTNRASRIVLARGASGSTTLTMFNDYEGDQSSFGLVIPVPASIDRDNVRLASRDLLDRVESYSAPRLVQYTCADFYGSPDVPDPEPSSSSSSGGSGCGGAWHSGGSDYGAQEDTGYGVVVEDAFDLGEYDAWVLQAGDGEGLAGWLAENGFALTPEAEALFDEYIASNAYFLALRVDLAAIPAGQDWLSPLQIGYWSDSWGLPIRMGTLSSAGEQDLVLYTITSPEQGRVGVSNYPEAALPPDECMLDVQGDPANFWEIYDAAWTEAVGVDAAAGKQGFAWTTEYSWGTGRSVKCDPCPDDGPLSNDEVFALGFDDPWSGWHVTRLRLRYTPEAVAEDLALYPTNIDDQDQVRYIVRRWELESILPVCGEQPSDPGSCYTAEYWARRAADPDGGWEDVPTTNYENTACNGDRSLLALPLALAFARRRRR